MNSSRNKMILELTVYALDLTIADSTLKVNIKYDNEITLSMNIIITLIYLFGYNFP